MSGEGPGKVQGGVLIPAEPYPGLRPFLDHEEILLFGRERQVREVLERLGETQFVAVIGGSGSGKSSLVLAGVVPELRSFGIPGAGDFWVPMVCTPGTNATRADREARRNTPITRLARRFASLLRSRGSAEQDAARLDEIAARLREELGFSTLVDLYTDELEVPPGPAASDARFLFVIDQFEELFHPTTRDIEDTRLLVERVIDHFFSPHPRCYIVLTMRSEHLNDCAGYLELPDAINKASYLVRRLDDDELGQAITLPAQRLLRLLDLAERPGARLPDAVEFDPDVLARLLRDVRAISDDPDHLPLLQHLLARVWQAAVARVVDRLDVPDRIVASDLAVAVSALPADRAPLPGDDVNALAKSLENWAEAAYQHHDMAGRAQLDKLLRRLAVKDPNTGMYSQQRIRVNDAAKLLGSGKTPEDLRALIADGFIGGVDYLFWDDDDPQRVTLKVSHESFIRGWERLRLAIDSEADRFAEFVELLRKCDKWRREGKPESRLLETGDLGQLKDAELQKVLASSDERTAWFRRLGATRGFAGLQALAEADGGADLDAFVLESVAHERQRLAVEGRRSRNRRLMWFGGLVLVPMFFYFFVVQAPVFRRVALLIQAAQMAWSDQITQPSPGVGSNIHQLVTLADAAGLIERGRVGDSPMQRLNREVLDVFARMPLLWRRAEFVLQVAAVTEPAVNARLRELLQSSIWLADPGLRSEAAASSQPTVEPAQCLQDASAGASGTATALKGRLFTSRSSRERKFDRSLFLEDVGSLVDGPSSPRSIGLFAARVDPISRQCSLTTRLMDLPARPTPAAIAFDASLRFSLVAYPALDERSAAAPGRNPGPESVEVQEIVWEIRDDEGNRDVHLGSPVSLTNAQDVLELRKALAPGPGGVSRQLLETRRAAAGRIFVVGDQGWRIFDQVATTISRDPKEVAGYRALERVIPGKTEACSRLFKRIIDSGLANETSMEIFAPADQSHCFMVTRTNEGSDKIDHIQVAVYALPLKSNVETAEGQRLLPAPIAFLPRFGRVPKDTEVTLMIGADAAHAGWVASKGVDFRQEPRFLAAPWSTCALARLGSEVLVYAARDPSLKLSPPAPLAVCDGR